MVSRASFALLVLASVASASNVSAQSMKPGLWEITNQVQSDGKDMTAAMASMQKQIAAMEPEQRKMMQDMLAKKGVQMDAGGTGGMRIKMCLTEEMVKRNEVAPQQQGNCTHTATPRVGNTMKYSFVCTKPASSGQGEITFTSPEAYSMKMAMTGANRSMEMQASGKWLGADCGDIKPIQIPAAK